jgi:hypothetical protein
MPPSGVEIAYETRVAVVVLRMFCSWTFQDIADKLDLQKRTAHEIYQRAVQRTEEGSKDSFFAVVQNVKDKKRTGRPPIIPPDSPALQQLRQLFLEHFDLPIELVTSHIAGLKMARSTAENVAHDHRHPECEKELVRAVQPIKPHITDDIQDLRVQYAGWAEQERNDSAIFIFVDESYLHFSGHLRKKSKITKPKGDDPTLFARHDPPEQFQLMLWGGIGPFEEEIPFPMWIWEMETEEEKNQAKIQLDELNLI